MFEICNLVVDLFLGFGFYAFACMVDANIAELSDGEPSEWNKLVNVL